MKTATPLQVGLVGCGTVGRRLGARVRAAGHDLVVFDRRPAAADPLLSLGATRAKSPAQLASGAAFILSCLPDADEVLSVAAGPEGLWAGAAAGATHVETSTVGPARVRELARVAALSEVRFIDAAFSRGDSREERVDNPALVLWVGANPDHFDQARPLLDVLAHRVLYCGEVGLGQTTKIVNNLIAHTLILLLGEALSLGVRSGASVELLASALREGTAQSRMLDELFPGTVFQGDFRPGLRLDLALKDLGLAEELAAEHGLNLELSPAVRALFERGMARGWDGDNAHVAVRLIEERTGVRLRSVLADED